MFRVLIVDDERIVLNGIRMIIEENLGLAFPVDIATASNGPQALQFLQHFTPDLILTDIRMPVMDGFELIRQIRNSFPAMNIAILTSHADFDYAVQGIHYQVTDFILKPIDEKILKDTIEKAYLQKQEKETEHLHSALLEVRNMMLYDLSPTELTTTPELVHRLFPHTYFTVIVVSLTEVSEGLEDGLKNILSSYYDLCYCFTLQEKKQLTAICNHDFFFVKPTDLNREFSEQTGCTAFWSGISISSNTYTTLHSLYTNAVQRIFYAKTFGDDDTMSGLSLVTYHECVQIFLEKDEEKVQELLTQYVDAIRSTSPDICTPDVIFRSFFHNIALFFENTSIPMPASGLLDAPKAANFAELVPEIMGYLSRIRKEIQKTSEYSGNDVQIRQLLNYIRENYQKDISLDDLADSVGLHPNYVCTLFKKSVGQSYLSCLHKERIRAAKKLLLDTDLSIEDIAHQVGYNSSSQLARVFRKYESLSPTDFRNQH